MASSAPVTTQTLLRLKADGEKIAVVTSYDASFTHLLEAAGVDVLLVGDSLGMVVQGHDSTLPVTLDDMIYHSTCVARAATHALRVVDLPFMTYATVTQALDSAARMMREGGAHMVKLEGGDRMLETVTALTQQGIPVCGHLGLTPQSVHQLGGYRVQGRDDDAARQLLDDALGLEQAGASMLVLECIPAALAKQVSERLRIPVIGIGAGVDCDGQVLVLYDLLGITPGKRPRFSHNFLEQGRDIPAALSAYVEAVKAGHFPAPEHTLA